MKRWTMALLIAVVFSAQPVLRADDMPATNGNDPHVAEVYIFSGQSNMEGQGKIAELPEAFQQSPDGVFYWNGKAFKNFDPEQTQTSKLKGNFGPEIGFVFTLHQLFPERVLYVVKTFASGQGLHAGWDGAQWKGSDPAPNRRTFYPGLNPDDPNTGVHYSRLRETFEKALKQLDEEGVKYRIAGFVWSQGGQDMKNEESAATYAQNLRLLKHRLEQDLGVQDLPIIYGQSGTSHMLVKLFANSFTPELRASQASADWRSGSEEAIPDAWMVPSEGMSLHPDLIHFNTMGQLVLGQSMALSMIQAHEMKANFDQQEALVKEATRILDERKARWAERKKREEAKKAAESGK